MAGQPRHRSKRGTRRRVRHAVAIAALALAAYPGVSYAHALTTSGHASVAVRTVDWLRTIGAGPAVDAAENWWYIHNVPSTGPPSAAALPKTGVRQAEPAPLRTAPGTSALPGEGQWSTTDGGVLHTTFVRPDAVHRSVVAGVARWSSRSAVLALHPGAQDPRGAARWGTPQVTPAERPTLLATFNSGFLMIDCNGGWSSEGHVARPLRLGAASLVIRRDGTATVGRWGHDIGPASDVVAVRQNLDLIIDRGAPVAGLDSNRASQFGNRGSQLQYTWRSGIGVDSAGNLIYVAGDQLTLATLAAALHTAGAVRGMQLDMHSEMVSFNLYHPGTSTPPTPLLPTMHSPATRYLTPDQRDFFTITTRPSTRTRAASLLTPR